MTEKLIILLNISLLNVASFLIYKKIFFNNNAEKLPLKIFKGIFLITCNTFFTIVLYSKVQGVCLALNILYFLCLEWISFYDMKNKIITNKSNIMLLILGLVYLLFTNVSLKQIVFNLTIAGGILLLGIIIRLLTRKQIGGGDIKMLASLSVRFNYIEMIKILIVAIFLGASYASYLLIFKKKDKNYRFAFGEFIAIGAILLII